MDHLDDPASVAAGVEDGPDVAHPADGLTEVGEVEPPFGVEDEVVGAPQRDVAAMRVQGLGGTGAEIDPLDRARGVVGRKPVAGPQELAVLPEVQAAVVAHVEAAIRPQGQTVGPAPDRRHQGNRAVRIDAFDGPSGDFCDQNGPIRERHRPLGKPQSFRNHLHGMSSTGCFLELSLVDLPYALAPWHRHIDTLMPRRPAHRRRRPFGLSHRLRTSSFDGAAVGGTMIVPCSSGSAAGATILAILDRRQTGWRRPP